MRYYTDIDTTTINLKTDFLLGILNRDESKITIAVTELHESKFPIDAILYYLYKITPKSLESADIEFITFIFDTIASIYNININVTSYSILTYMCMNSINILELDLKNILDMTFIADCNIDFLILFLSYYLDNLIYISSDYYEINRINTTLKEKINISLNYK